MKILIDKTTNKIIASGNDVIPSSDNEYIANIASDLSIWRGSKIFYDPIRRTFEKGDGFQSWNNTTRIEHPIEDLIGYNTEANRIEFYIKSIDRWLYLSSEFIAITEIPSTPHYTEDFENGWFVDNIFTSLFIEDLEIGWFINNSFSQLFTEDLELNWFINNTFNQLFTEAFEGGW